MHTTQKLSLFEAICINITIMIGTGLFINTVLLAQYSGPFVLLTFLATGCLMLPLVLSFAELIRYYPVGGFYTFASKTINPIVGFLSAWIYFFAKLASSTLGMHVFVCIMQQIIPPLAHIPTLALDVIIISSCTILNLLNLKTGSTLLKYFFILKLIPIATVLLASIVYGSGATLLELPSSANGILYTIPLVLFSLLGFEASCSLSNQIENAHKNGARAIIVSFSFVVLLSIAYQLGFYLILGSEFLAFTDYRQAFPALFALIIPHQDLLQKIAYTAIHAAIASSAFSGSYGMFYSLRWNMVTLAEHQHLKIGNNAIKQFNQYGSPFICTLFAGIICLCYVLITHGSLVTLQQLSAFGCTITYIISAFALLLHRTQNTSHTGILLPLTALASCGLLASICFYNLYTTGIGALIALGIITVAGIGLYKE